MTRPDPRPRPRPPGRLPGARCDCNGPCMCAAPVPLLRWFAAQVSVYHGPEAHSLDFGLCGQSLRMCGICMLVATLYRATHHHWPGILP